MTEEPDRLTRAREEDIDIHKKGPKEYDVVGKSGSTYEINLATMECTCEDYQMNDIEKCKHLYRGLLISGDLDD